MSKGPHPAVNDIEKSMLDALARIVAGKPINKILLKRAGRGTLKISVATVAMESGHSRTLISHDKCAYPRVRAEVLAFKKPKGEPTSLAEINRRLRMENAELRRTVKLARESMAAMLLRMERVVREADRRVAAARRKETRSDNPNEVAGRFSSPSTGLGVVVDFNRDRPKESP